MRVPRTVLWRLLGLVFVLTVVAACDAPLTRALLDATPSPTPEDIADEIRFRTLFGLRADEAWIRLVAHDPGAKAGISAYGLPLTHAEKAALDARSANANELVPILAKCGRQHQDEWAGLYIEPSPNGAVVAQFTGNLPKHSAAITRLVNPKSRFRLQLVQYSIKELKAVFERVARDEAFLQSIDAEYWGGGVSVAGPRVSLYLATANERAPELVREKFGLTEDQIEIKLRAPFWKGPSGLVVVRAVDVSGRPVRGLSCYFTPDVPLTLGEVGLSTQADGTCRIEIAATSFTVELKANVTEGVWKVVGRGHVRVPANRTAFTTIVVRDLPPPPTGDEPPPPRSNEPDFRIPRAPRTR